MSIVAKNETYNGLSGKYNFHSLKNNTPAFIREGGKLSGLDGENHYLTFHEETKSWYIQIDKWFLIGRGGGFFSNESSGMFSTLYCQSENS